MDDEFGREKELVWEIVARARAKGASAAEAYYSEEEESEIEVRDFRVENLKLAREQGVGLRVLVGQRLGFAFTTDLSREGLERLVDEAVANAAQTAKDPYHVFPAAAVYPGDLDLYDPRLEEAALDEKIGLALRLEQSGREYDPRIRATESAAYRDSRYRVVVANSNGLLGAYKGANCSLNAVFVAGDEGGQETGFAFQYRLKLDQLDPEEVGRTAASKAVRMLGAKPISSRTVPVVMDPYVTVNFLGVLASSFSADAVQKGRSLLAAKPGSQVGSAAATIVDDGVMAGGLASAPFDGEGVPCRRTVLVENGVLLGFLHNSYTAAKAQESSTGNAARSSFRNTPGVGVSNLYLASGEAEPQALVAGVGRGLYLTEVLGMHTANPVSGDFSVGAAGFLIENGEITAPVRGITAAGNILEWLATIEACGRDLTFMGGMGAPTVLVGRMVVSG
jgi:PmbA protein